MRLLASIRTTLLAAILLIFCIANAETVGDNHAIPVTWKGDSALNNEGAPIVLRFQLKQATLFGVEFY